MAAYKPSLHLNSCGAKLFQVRRMKIRRRLLDTGQDECLTICVSQVRNRIKQLLPWHPRELHDTNEVHFLYCTIISLWASHCLPTCPGRQRSNSRFRQSQIKSCPVANSWVYSYRKLETVFSIPFSCFFFFFCVCVLEVKSYFLLELHQLLVWWALQETGSVAASIRKRGNPSTWRTFWMKAL